MSEHTYDDFDDPETTNAELVHWMEPRPLTFGPAGLSLAVAGAFTLGLAAALIAIGVSRLAGPERRMSGPLEHKLRRLS